MLFLAFVYLIPIGMIQAITNQQVGLNVITELIVGYALPGRPVAMMLFKTWGYITMAQALQFSSDFKLGHYMKIPPRTMFSAQTVATMVAGTVQLGVQAWMFTNIKDMCQSDQKDGFICPSTQVFGTASIVWGVIGPRLQFSEGQMYHKLVYFFLVGAIAPIIPWALTKRWPNSMFRYVKYVTYAILIRSIHTDYDILKSARYLRWYRPHPTSNSGQLRALDDRRVHLPVRYPTEALLVVDEIQLRPFRRARLGRRRLDRRHLLLPAVPER